MFVSGLSEYGYLSNALLTELMPAQIPIFGVHGVNIKRNQTVKMWGFFYNFENKKSSVFFTKRSCLFAFGFKL